jgi:predicted O-methyltransferase YrrM
MEIVLDKNAINDIDLTPLGKYVDWNTNNYQFFNLEAGKEHYKLLAYLSQTLNCPKLVEIGTYLGYSAVAFSINPNKQICSYDIFNWLPSEEDGKTTAESKSNIKLYVGDYMNDFEEIVKGTDLIMIDIDHSGVTEAEIMDILRKQGYKGLVLLDDINLNDEMRKFWASIPEKKLDITSVGHWSGTGLVIMDPTRFTVTL